MSKNMNMSDGLVFRILKELTTTTFYYKGMRVNMLGLPASLFQENKNSFSSTLSKLKKDGFVCQKDDKLMITKKGREYVARKIASLKFFKNNFEEKAKKDLIVMFDIPENKKAEREWFRWHLKKFHYEMIQRSVWVGPSPLPKEFLGYLKSIGLENCIKTFKLAKSYDKNKNS